MKIMGVLYKATDPHGHCYIGQHQGDGSDIGITYFGSGKYIKAARKKHGDKYFTYWVFAKSLTQEERNQGEKYYIKFFQSSIKENGYNIAPGGEGKPTGIAQSEESKKKMSNSRIGKKDSDITRKKKSDAWNNKSKEEKNLINQKRSKSIMLNNTLAVRKQKSESAIKANTPELRKKKSENSIKTWADPIVRKKRVDALLITQNITEVKLKRAKTINNKSNEEKAETNRKKSINGKIAQNLPEVRKKNSDSNKIAQMRPEVISKKAKAWNLKSKEVKRKQGGFGRHIRWHFNRGVLNLDCQHCIEQVMKEHS